MRYYKLCYIFIVAISLALVIALLVSSCASSPPTPTNPPPAQTTTGQYADAGKTVFAGKCAGCHGDMGQGAKAPSVIGAKANLGKYKHAQGLLDYIARVMPYNAPGSLSQQDYTEVLAFLLVQNKLTSPESPFDLNQLDSLSLAK